MNCNILLILSIVCLISCGCKGSGSREIKTLEIQGRGDPYSSSRSFIYRAHVPEDWIVHQPSEMDLVLDTREPLCEWLIKGADEQHLKIVFHNFPHLLRNENIPPVAQISRWQKQFDALDPVNTTITPQAFNGFTGFQYEARGIRNKEEIALIAWAMQLADSHDATLYFLQQLSDLQQRESIQMRADWTIKVTGPPSLLQIHKNRIISFARNFELIREIPKI